MPPEAGPDDADLQSRLQAVTGERELSPERRRELELTIACDLQRPAALEAFDALLRGEVARVVRPIDPALVDEVCQRVRERLLLPGAEGRCRIAEYRADAPLQAWLRAIALRTALNDLRTRGREVPASQAPELQGQDLDPELALIGARYRDSFREAFAAATAALSPRERTVLRLHTLDGVTLARIGALYRKDTSTVSRWLDRIRETLLASTRDYLAAHLGLSPGELDSVMRAAPSQMSVSLQRLLAPGP